MTIVTNYLENQFKHRGTSRDDDTVPGPTDAILIVLIIFSDELAPSAL